ncbi:MAG: signal peptidase II [Candidatus Competibacterales bacterium]
MLKWLWLSGVIVVLDQGFKALAVAYLELHWPLAVTSGVNLTLTYNPGAAFSFLAGAGGWQRWVLLGLAVGVSGVLIFWLRRLPSEARLTALALSAIIGGALGNAIDRALWGAVIDYIDLYAPWGGRTYHWPAFNVADAAISSGAGLLVFESFRPHRGRGGS